MTFRINDEAPNFVAQTTQEKLIFINGWGRVGECYFHILKISHRFVPLS